MAPDYSQDFFTVESAGLAYEFDSYPDDAALTERKSPDEALIACINTCGQVDLPFLRQLTGMRSEQLLRKLRGSAIFQDPAVFTDAQRWSPDPGWLVAPRYLCGNIPAKLELARSMNERFPGRFEANIEALRRLLPAKLRLEEIHVTLGAFWIPEHVYAAFLRDLFGLSTPPSVHFNRELSVWRIEAPPFLRSSVANNYTYGTLDLPAIKIIEQTMNARTVKVYDSFQPYNGPIERVLNKAKTLEAQEKQRKLLRAFARWVQKDAARRAELQECYNEALVGYSFSPYNGDFLSLPGLNPNVALYRHQRSAIARILLSNSNVLLAHDVGSGKTYEMIVSAHELKRMGLSDRNLIVVPNNVLKATVDAHRLLYPQDRILAVYPKDFTPKTRNAVLESIRDDDHVCVYMAYSSFDMVVMSKAYWMQKQQDEISSLLSAAAGCASKDEKFALEREAEQRKKKLSKYCLEHFDAPWLSYDQLGVQTLFLDEAHNYKNIPLQTRTDNIVGMHSKGSKKCREMFEKCHATGRVVFATGTPLTNSLADLFVLQSYLQPEELQFRGIDSFDMWINAFGERETNFEIDVDSGSIRPITRFSSFHNLTELMSLFSTVCDFHQTETEDETLPRFDGHENVCVPKGPAQTAYIKHLSGRTELIRAHKVKRTEDNLLKVTTDGRKCALDIRLVDAAKAKIFCTPPDYSGGKLVACAEKIVELYRSHPGTCQLVFSDLGTPKPGFNVYDKLRAYLIERGIPAAEIAFAHDAVSESARAKLFARINAGTVRVVIGSTAKLGIGVNVQERLVALHHLSVPWRPADMVQREGRIIRRGNSCEQVYIYRYITEGSFDSYSWQLLENKQRFISSFLSGTSAARDRDDIADTVLSYAEVKALAIGNPLIKKRVETANRLERARLASCQRQKQLINLRSVLENVPETLKKLNELKRRATSDADYYAGHKEPVPMEERLAFGEELLEALGDNAERETERLFDSYQGFDILLPAHMEAERPHVYLSRKDGGRYYVDMGGDKALGCAMRLDRTLESLPKRIEAFEAQIRDAETQQAEAARELAQGNPYQREIQSLSALLETIDKKLAMAGGKAS